MTKHFLSFAEMCRAAGRNPRRVKNWMILSDDFPTPDVEVGGSHMAGWDPDRVPSITQWMDNYESTLNPRKMRTRSTP